MRSRRDMDAIRVDLMMKFKPCEYEILKYEEKNPYLSLVSYYRIHSFFFLIKKTGHYDQFANYDELHIPGKLSLVSPLEVGLELLHQFHCTGDCRTTTRKYEINFEYSCRIDLTVLLVHEYKKSKMRAAYGSECSKPASLIATQNLRPWRRAIATGGGTARAHQYPYIIHGLLKLARCNYRRRTFF